VDSRYRNTSIENTNNFSVNLPTSIKINYAVKLIYSSVGNSIYLFNGSNNTFQISYNGGSAQTITFATGNPTAFQIASQIQTQMLTLYPSSNFTCTYNQQTIQLNFSANNNFTIIIPAVTIPSQFIGDVLGFPAGNTSSVSNQLNSTNIMNLNPIPYYYIYIDKLTNYNIIGQKNIKASFFVPMLCNPSTYNNVLELITFENLIFTTTTPQISQFQVSLFDMDGYPLNINNTNWQAYLIYQ